MEKKEACIEAVRLSCPSVFTSGSIIILAGYIIHFISTTAAIGDLGHLIGRGAVYSVCLVLTVLPALLVMFDGVITSNEWERLGKWMEGRRKARHQRLKAAFGRIREKRAENGKGGGRP